MVGDFDRSRQVASSAGLLTRVEGRAPSPYEILRKGDLQLPTSKMTNQNRIIAGVSVIVLALGLAKFNLDPDKVGKNERDIPYPIL